jgi:hypothetical protein
MASRWAAVLGAADTPGSFWYVGMGEVKSWDVSIDACCRCQLSCSARGLDRFQHTNRGYVKMHVTLGFESEVFLAGIFPYDSHIDLWGGKKCDRMPR